jgi:enoyl-CoA hydratase
LKPNVRLEFEENEKLAIITLACPEGLNMLSTKTMDELSEVIARLEGNDKVRVAILTGEGRSFAVGANVKEFLEQSVLNALDYIRKGQSILGRLENLNVPVIAAINGFALGGGTELALACTYRVAAEGSIMGLPEAKYGVIPSYGGTQRLARLVGKARAFELTMLAKRITAEEALTWGLVNQVVPQAELIAYCKKDAAQVIKLAPIAIRMLLYSIHRGVNMALDDGLIYEAVVGSTCFDTEDKNEGINAFLEKREPNFQGK